MSASLRIGCYTSLLVALCVIDLSRPRPAAAPVRTVAQAVGRLEGFCVVPIDPAGDLDAGVYLTDGPRAPRSLPWLAADAKFQEKWAGVVMLRTAGPTFAEGVTGWPEGTARVGPFILVGDPDMVAECARRLK